jgi:hypothetical protein
MGNDTARQDDAVRREALVSRVSKLQTFVASALIASLALFVILEQQIRDFGAQMRRVSITRRHASLRLEETATQMRALRTTIDRAIEYTSESVRSKKIEKTREALLKKAPHFARALTASEAIEFRKWMREMEKQANAAGEKAVHDLDAKSELTEADHAALQDAYRFPPVAETLGKIDEAMKRLTADKKGGRYTEAAGQFAKYRTLTEQYLGEHGRTSRGRRSRMVVPARRQTANRTGRHQRAAGAHPSCRMAHVDDRGFGRSDSLEGQRLLTFRARRLLDLRASFDQCIRFDSGMVSLAWLAQGEGRWYQPSNGASPRAVRRFRSPDCRCQGSHAGVAGRQDSDASNPRVVGIRAKQTFTGRSPPTALSQTSAEA